jgi:hypothetical protein
VTSTEVGRVGGDATRDGPVAPVGGDDGAGLTAAPTAARVRPALGSGDVPDEGLDIILAGLRQRAAASREADG